MDQISSQNNKEDKIGTRRATHNEVERRRRDNINNWIMKLSKLLPDCGNSGDSGVGGSQGKTSQSKGGILAKACEFLADMRNINQRLADSLKHTEEANQENERLSSQIEQLQVRRWIFSSDRSSRSANVRPFVRSFVSNLSRAVNLHLSGSVSTQSIQSIKIRVIQSEP